MCGIAGLFGLGMPAQDARHLIGSMVAEIAHRGPDDRGVLVDGRVALGHARLSLVDLAGGTQPMVDEESGAAIVFNGEVFNHVELRRGLAARGARFRTQSDTEVILHLFREEGASCVEALNGDFAFAIWDRRKGLFMLARDRCGVRPLFYSRTPHGLCFASEAKALLSVPGVSAEADPFALCQIFTMWSPLPPRTAFRDIRELPPGHVLVAADSGVSVRRYWRLCFPWRGEEGPGDDSAALSDELRALVADAVRLRLRADVPVGAYLSGGLDSAVIAALAREGGAPGLKTFSMCFEAPEFDESERQLDLVRALGTEHASVLCSGSDIAAVFPEVIRHVERPILRTAPAPMFMLSELVRRSGIKAVLTGEGADEVLAGYDLFKEAKVRAFCARRPGSRLRPLLFRRLYPYLPGIQAQSTAYLEACFGAGRDDPDDPLFSHLPRFAAGARSKVFFSDDLKAELGEYDPLDDLRSTLPSDFARWAPLHQAQYLESTHLLPGYILSAQGDRVAMAHGVEGRFPFLDHRVVEFASRIPPSLKLMGLREKHVLRRSMATRLPAAVGDRPKRPYRAPDSQSFLGRPAPGYVDDLLSPGAIADTGFFHPGAVERLVNKCRARGAVGFSDNQAFVGVLSTQLWREAFRSSWRGARPVTAPARDARLL